MSRWPADIYRLCLVTDAELARGRSLVSVVAEAVAGGVTLVQLREKTAPTRAMISEAAALRDLLRPLGIAFVINDRVDVALAVGADGVHLGQDDMPIETARRLLGPEALIGLSITQGTDLARPDAALADYLGVGPVFLQATKPDAAAPLGLDGLKRLRGATDRPILAIGGIGIGNARAVCDAGADGIAVVSAIMAADDPREAAGALRTAFGR